FDKSLLSIIPDEFARVALHEPDALRVSFSPLLPCRMPCAISLQPEGVSWRRTGIFNDLRLCFESQARNISVRLWNECVARRLMLSDIVPVRFAVIFNRLDALLCKLSDFDERAVHQFQQASIARVSRGIA